jgi:hypothetical protein
MSRWIEAAAGILVGFFMGIAFGIFAGCATTKKAADPGHVSTLPGGGYQIDGQAPPFPVPTKAARVAAPASAAAALPLVPYRVVGMRSIPDPKSAGRRFFVKLAAPTGEQFEVETSETVWANAAFAKVLCLDAGGPRVCP